MKRLISCNASDLKTMSKEEKLLAIQASEGRTVMAEMTMNGAPDALENCSMGELYAAFGADMLLLNKFDVFHPAIPNISENDPERSIEVLKRFTGRLIGLNLEPVPERTDMPVEQVKIPEGRKATPASARKAAEMGADYIVLTGNPGTGCDNVSMIDAIRKIKEEVKDELIIVAGKMHAAGSMEEAGNQIITKDIIKKFAQAGADIILIPAPGTVPGITLEWVRDLVEYAHSLHMLTLTAIGTSQEDSDPETIRQIALMCKMSGTDLHHIGDAGHAGCVAESIMSYSIAIRGKRHTYNRMATSVMR